MRAMILGAGGMLGHDLVSSAPEGVELHALTRAELDITDTASLAARVSDEKPDVILNTAAYTAVDRAEAERDLCFRVNAEAVGELVRIAARARARVVHFSTDYVFNGKASQPYKEDNPTDPVNAYGGSKLAGEQALRTSGADWLIVRTQWLFGIHGKSFPRTMWERASAGLETRVVNDQTGRPTYSKDLATAVWQLTERGARCVRTCRTAPGYRLYALDRTMPPKPGLVRDPEFAGPGIEVEVWAVPEHQFGSFVAGVPAPLGIGNAQLDSGALINPPARRDQRRPGTVSRFRQIATTPDGNGCAGRG